MTFRLRLIVLLPLIALVFAGLTGLGLWQLARGDYKDGLEEERGTRTAAPPLDAEAVIALPPEEIDYRRVAIDGRWDHERTMTISNRFRFGIRGEDVVTPLLLSEQGPAVLVNRGWVPLSQRERVLDELAREPKGHIEGLARTIVGGVGQEIGPGTWNRLHVPSMAETLPYEVVPWQLLEGELLERLPLTPPPELPVRGFVGYDNTTPHMQYALTWFGFAATLAVTAFLRIGLRRGGEVRPVSDASPAAAGEAVSSRRRTGGDDGQQGV